MLTSNVKKIKQWFNISKLSLNMNQTNFFFFFPKEQIAESMDGINISHVKSVKPDQIS